MASVTRRSGPRGRREENRAQNLRRLTEALEELLGEGESFTEIPVERLAARAGVSRSTFYVHFCDKGTLLRELSSDLVAQLLTAGRGWWGRPPPASRQELRERIAVIVETYRPHAGLMRAVTDTSTHDAGVREVFRELTGRYVDELCAHIEAGRREGTVRADLPPRATAEMLTWMAERGLGQMLRSPVPDDEDGDASDRTIEAFTAVTWNALYEGAPGQSLDTVSRHDAHNS